MNQSLNSRTRTAFSWWVRTGGLPSMSNADGLELKFNPWHDPADGRFTSGGSGRHAGGSASHRSADNAHSPGGERPRADRALSRSHAASSLRMPAPVRPSRSGEHLNPAAEFALGAGEGLYDAGKGAVMGAYAALTTSPATTIRETTDGIARMIDSAIAAEDTPAHVQLSRAAKAIGNASARDLGRATGSVAGNAAIMLAPEAAFSKFADMRAIRRAEARPQFPPPKVGWAKENFNRDTAWKRYNDGATGARAGYAPTLMRTLPDGTTRAVKFDGIDADWYIDRKMGVRDQRRFREQALRQSAALAEHRLIGIWEVPSPAVKAKALKILKKLDIKNIKVRIIEP